MRPRHALVGVILAAVLTGCGGGSSPGPAAPEPASEPAGEPIGEPVGEPIGLTGMVGRVQDVTGLLDQRQAEIESLLP